MVHPHIDSLQDLVEMADAEIEDMRNRMTKAASEDSELVNSGLPASAKLKMLPQVVALLNRNQVQGNILDPDTNLLEAVRFFLEPLQDGSLPAYNIQRELFAALTKLPMTKDALIASGIGKVIVFYKKSKRSEPAIKRQATKLMEEWSRPLLQRSDDYSKKRFQTVAYNPNARRDAPVTTTVQRKVASAVGPGKKDTNRARPVQGTMSYSIVPAVNHVPTRLR
jgi:transcription factor SPN1